MRVPTRYGSDRLPSATPLRGPSGAGATPQAFGADVAQSMLGLARVAQQGIESLRVQEQSRQKFDELRKLTAFESMVNQTLTEAKRNSTDNPQNFGAAFGETYAEMERQFLEQIADPELREEFSVRTGELGTRVQADALEYQYGQTDQYFRNGIADEFNRARVELGQGGTLADLDEQRAKLDAVIDSTSLSDAEKTQIRRNAYAGLEAVTYKNEQVRLLEAEAAGGSAGPARGQAKALMEIIRSYTPDEIDDAVQIGEQLAVQSLGSIDMWAALPARVRASLITTAADYGGLPPDVVAAVRSGDLDAIAGTIRALPTPEADSIADLITNPAATIDDDPAFDNLPYEDRVALTQDAAREVAAMQEAQAKAETAQNNAMVNALHVALFDGTAGQMEIDQAREQGWLSDIDDIMKAQKLLEDRDEGLRSAQYAQDRLSSGVPFNPNSDDDKNALNAYIGEEGLKAIRGRDSDYVRDILVPTVRTGQDIPQAAIGEILGMMRSQDNEMQAWALDTLSQLQQASPRAFSHRMTDEDESTVAFWNDRKDMYPQDELLSMVRGGLTAEERRLTANLREEAIKILDNDQTGPQLAASAMSAFNVGGWGGPSFPALPWSSRGFASDFRTRFVDEYAKYGDVEKAKQAAIAGLGRDWSVTDIGGTPTLMKWAPQNVGYLPLDGSYDWIEEQVMDDLGLFMPGEGWSIPLTPADFAAAQARGDIYADAVEQGLRPVQGFRLISDEQTRAEAGANKRFGPAPSYMIAVTDMNGNQTILMEEVGDKGNEQLLPRRIYFEVTPEMEARQVEEFMAKRETALRIERGREYLGAVNHSVQTGTFLPDDIRADALGITPAGQGVLSAVP